MNHRLSADATTAGLVPPLPDSGRQHDRAERRSPLPPAGTAPSHRSAAAAGVAAPMRRQPPSGPLKKLGWRLYEELILPPRQDEYRQLLQAARDQGYQVIDNEQWLAMVRAGGPAPGQRVLVMRHDIDTDPRLSLQWHRIEHELGCRASYYFRQSTCDEQVIRTLAAAGVHVSYHFEELATVAKQRRLKSPEAARAAFPEAQALFGRNLKAWRERFGLPMTVVCSHGDWMNRHLKMPNRLLLKDDALRQQLGIDSECYDDEVMQPFACYLSDSNPPHFWVRGEPFALIAQGTTPLGILTHPKSWRAHWPSNFSELTGRIVEALRFRFGKGWQ